MPELDDLLAHVDAIRRERGVPGIGLALIVEGRIVVQTGQGVRCLGKPEPVDDRTLFCIASNTKAFTAASLALLVDEGKIAWDDRVTQHLPHFQMYDPYVTREITIRDLLTHRSGLGLGQGDLLTFPPTEFTREEIVFKQRFLKPKTSFRNQYAYDNLLYIVASEVVPAVTGQTWESFVRERIFGPVGMTRTCTSVSECAADATFATSHVRADGGRSPRIWPVDFVHGENSNPAGGIYSNAGDMARWALTQLRAGQLPGDGPTGRLFSTRQSAEMWSPQTILPPSDDSLPSLNALPNSHFSCYGLGWRLCDYAGCKVAWHSGCVLGMVSRVTLVPERGVGVVLLTNLEDDEPLQSITVTILDHLLGLTPTDWPPVFRAAREREIVVAAVAEAANAAARVTTSTPSLPLTAYAGPYRDDWMGDATILLEASGLVLRFAKSPGLVGDLEHYQYDTFIARWRDRSIQADAYVTFALRPDGGIDQIKMAPVSPLTDFSYDFQDLLLTPK